MNWPAFIKNALIGHAVASAKCQRMRPFCPSFGRNKSLLPSDNVALFTRHNAPTPHMQIDTCNIVVCYL